MSGPQACVVGAERGLRRFPTTASSGHRYCAKHDLERKALNSEQASRAAQASHATGRNRSATLLALAESLAWTDSEANIRFSLEQAARLLFTGALTPSEAHEGCR